jgi:hypothetical protein
MAQEAFGNASTAEVVSVCPAQATHEAVNGLNTSLEALELIAKRLGANYPLGRTRAPLRWLLIGRDPVS